MEAGELGQRDLPLPPGCRDEHPAEHAQVGAEVAQVAHVHRIALASLDGGGDVFAPDRVLDGGLRVVDGEAVARQRGPVPLDVDEIAGCAPLGEDAARAAHSRQELFHLHAEGVDGAEVSARDLETDRGAHARREHVDAAPHWHGPGVGDAG